MRWIMINQLDGAVLSLGPPTTGAKKEKERKNTTIVYGLALI